MALSFSHSSPCFKFLVGRVGGVSLYFTAHSWRNPKIWLIAQHCHLEQEIEPKRREPAQLLAPAKAAVSPCIIFALVLQGSSLGYPKTPKPPSVVPRVLALNSAAC